MNGNNRRCLSDGRKEMQSPEKIEDVKKENPCQSKKDAIAWAVMGFRGFARVRANPFLECRDNQRTRSCFL